VVVQAALRERARIAEAMHDQLGHDLALLALQAGGLQISLDKGTLAHEQASKIRSQADEAIEHLHQIIGVLHDAVQRAPLEPAATALDQLVERTRSKGMDIKFTRLGSPPAAGGASLLHQVAQEALTNAAKYAPRAPVDMVLDSRSDPTVLRISNPLTGEVPAVRSGATGLASLRTALEAHGGSLRTNHSGKQFELVAVIAQPKHSRSELAGQVPVKRRSRLAIIFLPALAVVLVASGLLLLQNATYRATALHPTDFRNLAIGMTHNEVDQIVHAKGLDEPLPVIDDPARPSESQCRYYAARAGVLDLGSEMFRLCFTADSLVSADHLYPRR